MQSRDAIQQRPVNETGICPTTKAQPSVHSPDENRRSLIIVTGCEGHDLR